MSRGNSDMYPVNDRAQWLQGHCRTEVEERRGRGEHMGKGFRPGPKCSLMVEDLESHKVVCSHRRGSHEVPERSFWLPM